MLTHLELVACDLSTSAWLGLETIRLTLQSLACYDSMEELRHLLAPSSGGFRSPGAYHVSFSLMIHSTASR